MKSENWLYGADGKVRPELYTISPTELDKIQQRAMCVPDYCPIPPALAALKSGDKIYVEPRYSIASEFAGEMTFIALDGTTGDGPAMFCRTANGGGGFISQQMLRDRNNPRLQVANK